ncbi:hypothetical protein J2S89_001499 [Arthrobacter bambusae]|nr:hypothetical protein [Arthrobacter bambusae]MDQ0097339.1 hypothetical protein [Arthrobacter bambusae]
MLRGLLMLGSLRGESDFQTGDAGQRDAIETVLAFRMLAK